MEKQIRGKLNIQEHLDGNKERTEKIVEVFKKYVSPKDKILEIGSCAGRNLLGLHRAGYKNLTGLDVDEKAINRLKKNKKGIKTILADVTDVDFEEYDVIFSMSTLFVIEDETSFVEIAQKAKKYFVLIEGMANTGGTFFHDYKKIFEIADFELIEHDTNVFNYLGELFVFKKSETPVDVRPEITTYQVGKELERIEEALTMVKGVPGSLIEVGVFEGGSAELLAKAYPKKKVYLFDTFEGLPDKLNFKAGDTQSYYVGHAKSNEITCREYLKPYTNVEIHKGVFPDFSSPVKDKKFCFAHIDVDIYQSTKESLEFIYPKMNKGGIILVHDYPAHPGVKNAVDEFMKDKSDQMRQEGVDIGLPRQLFITKK